MGTHENTAARRWEEMRVQLMNARRSQGTQDELAAAIGCARNTITRTENGTSDPAISLVIAMAEALDLRLALVPPHLARLLALTITDITALISAASAANRRIELSPQQQARLLTALVKIHPGAGR